MAFVSTFVEFPKFSELPIGHAIIGKFLGMEEGSYGEYCAFLSEDGTKKIGISAGSVKYKAERGQFIVGDRVKIVYQGVEKAKPNAKYKKDFYTFDVAVDLDARPARPVAANTAPAQEKLEEFSL